MSNQKLLQQMIGVTLVMLLLAGCSGAPTTPVKTVDEWIEILESGDEAERLEAVIALGKMGPAASDALPQLFVAIAGEEFFIGGSEGSFVDEVGTAIAAIAEEDAVALCEVWFLDASGYGLFCVSNVLPKVGEGAVPGLVDILTTRDDVQSRLAAALTLGRMAEKDALGENKQLAIDALQTAATDDPAARVRDVAQSYLEKLE